MNTEQIKTEPEEGYHEHGHTSDKITDSFKRMLNTFEENGIEINGEPMNKLKKEKIDLNNFLDLTEGDYSSIEFRDKVALRKPKIKIQSKIIGNEKEKLIKDIRVELIKFLQPGYKDEKSMDENFQMLIDNKEYDTGRITNAFNSSNFMVEIKPFVFDLLKRYNRIDSIKSLVDVKRLINNERKNFHKVLTERDLICAFVESVSEKSLPRLGQLISKNDYPLPLLYQVYNQKDDSVVNKINFSLFNHLLCLTDKSLLLVTQTSTIKDEPSVLPVILKEINENSIFKSDKKMGLERIDVLCNYEKPSDWIIVDCNGVSQSNEYKCLIRSFEAFSSLHLIKTSSEDYGEDGEPSDEIKQVFDRYRKIQQINNMKNVVIFVLIYELGVENQQFDFYDSDQENSDKVELINHKLASLYNQKYLTVVMMNDDYKSKLRSAFNKADSDGLLKRPIHSMFDIRNFYETFNLKLEKIVSDAEKNFEYLFNSENITKIFPISKINKMIDVNQTQIKKMIYNNFEYQNNRLEASLRADIKILESQLREITCLNDHLNYFIDLLKPDDFLSNISIFEKCLFSFKKKTKLRADVDLTIENFWDEIFLFFDNNNNKSNLRLRSLLVDRYIKLIDNGFSIHILRGQPMRVESSFLREVFNKLNERYKNISILSIFGEQSSAKSSLLNSLFGLDFRTESGRCTIGIYMNFVRTRDSTIAILDTEGLSSIEVNNFVFDNQITTMVSLCSNLILINHRGEMSCNLQRLLGITFYAKLRINESAFKPKIVFVLRDSFDRTSEKLITEAQKLKENLVESARNITDKSVDSVFNIDVSNIKLMPSAFSENDDKKCRNTAFSKHVLDLREYLLESMINNNIEQYYQPFDSLVSVYEKLSSDWQTLIQIGDGILNCKDIEELRIRNEISNFSHKLIQVFAEKLSDSILKVKLKNVETLRTNFSDSLFEETKREIQSVFNNISNEMCATFKKRTEQLRYPESISREFESRLRSNLESILVYQNKQLKELKFKFKQKSNLIRINSEITEFISEKLKTSLNPNEIKKLLHQKFHEQDEKFNRIQSEFFKSEQDLIIEIERSYSQNIDLNRKILISPYDDIVPSTVDLKSTIDSSKWKKLKTTSGIINKIKDKSRRFFFNGTSHTDSDSYMEELCHKMRQELSNSIDSHALKNSHIQKAFMIINERFLSRHSRYKDNFEEHIMIKDLIEILLKEICTRLCYLQRVKEDEERNAYQESKDKLERDIDRDLKNMENSKQYGDDFGDKFLTSFFKFILGKYEVLAEQLIKNQVEKFFPLSDSLVEEAYKHSFDALNYENVYKYVTDINRFCEEIFRMKIKASIDLIITEQIHKLREKIEDFFIRIKTFLEIPKSSKTIYEFINDLSKYLAELNSNESFNEFLEFFKKEKIDTEIGDLKSFEIGLKNVVKETYSTLNEYFEDKEQLFKIMADTEIKKYCLFKLGCESTCPGCGSKCNKFKGHKGIHETKKHLIGAFSGWKHVHDNRTTLKFCWEEIRYLNTRVIDGDKTYTNLNVYISEKYPNWVENVDNMYKEHGKPENKKNDFVLDYIYKVKRSWMNTRKAVIKFHNHKDHKFYDACNYEKEWKNLEDEKILTKNFQPSWD